MLSLVTLCCWICLVLPLCATGFRVKPTTHPLFKFRSNTVTSINRDVRPLYAGEFVDASYDLAAGSAVIGTVFGVLENFKGKLGKVFGVGAILFTLFGGFVAFQTSTLAFNFDEDSFSLVKRDGESIGENVVVGGENDWKYNTFVNWEFLPSKKIPILVYFKETQTPVENRIEDPIVIDKLDGQAHFFPAIARSDQLEQQFLNHNCKRS